MTVIKIKTTSNQAAQSSPATVNEFSINMKARNNSEIWTKGQNSSEDDGNTTRINSRESDATSTTITNILLPTGEEVKITLKLTANKNKVKRSTNRKLLRLKYNQ